MEVFVHVHEVRPAESASGAVVEGEAKPAEPAKPAEDPAAKSAADQRMFLP